MRKPKKLPTTLELHELFEYDPLNGGIWRKGEEHLDYNLAGCVNSGTGYRCIYIKGYGNCLAHRIIWKMFYRVDPVHYQIDHKNCDRQDNRIENLRKVKMGSKTQAKNQRKKLKYVVNENGVGRCVSCISDDECKAIG